MLSKTNGQVVRDVMTPAPVVVRETTNLEDAARYFYDIVVLVVLCSALIYVFNIERDVLIAGILYFWDPT